MSAEARATGAPAAPRVVVFDYGSGNVHSALRALRAAGADAHLSGDAADAQSADGLFVPGVGNFHACVAGLRAAGGHAIIDRRLAGGRPVLGVCVGMQVLFDGSEEPAVDPHPGLGQWPGTVTRLEAPVVPHMGWSPVRPPAGSILFDDLDDELFYFVHSYAAASWQLAPSAGSMVTAAPAVTWSEHGQPFVAAVENGPLSATQFHPEKSGDAGLRLLKNWVRSL